MSLSDRHEELVDLVFIAINFCNLFTYEKTDNISKMITGSIDHSLAVGVQPELFKARVRADGYIWLPDDNGIMVLEVGSMPENKWNGWVYGKDAQLIRILRVGWDKNFYIRNNKNTVDENNFTVALKTVFDNEEIFYPPNNIDVNEKEIRIKKSFELFGELK